MHKVPAAKQAEEGEKSFKKFWLCTIQKDFGTAIPVTPICPSIF